MSEFNTTGLRLYNTLTKKEEEFSSVNGREVTMYTCGPTVYGRPHIGNYAAFLMADLLRRWLETQGYTVKHAKNITDVGHLVKDADDGEDKIEKQAREEFGSVTHDSVLQVARSYEKMYLEDEHTLNFLEPPFRPRATEFIDQMKEMIEELLAKKSAYITDDGIYFDVSTFPQYGGLSGNSLDALSAGARVQVNEQKRHPADFALWKFCVSPNEHHALRWSSPTFAEASVGRPGGNLPDGFPGWHIECSAMSRALLGDTIDIHTGGEDNIFPHHECEIAQSESVTKKPFVRFWLHRRRIEISMEGILRNEQEGIAENAPAQKMSKSLGNVLTIPNIIERGYDPMDIRYYLLSVHYRTNLKFSWKGMDDSKKARAKIVEWMKEVENMQADGECNHDQHESLSAHYSAFRDAMNNDLNTSGALAAIFELMNWSRTAGPLCADALADLHMAIVFIRHTFGCFDSTDLEIPSDVQTLLNERADARANKDFALSDSLRAKIAELGYIVKDTDDGQKVTKK